MRMRVVKEMAHKMDTGVRPHAGLAHAHGVKMPNHMAAKAGTSQAATVDGNDDESEGGIGVEEDQTPMEEQEKGSPVNLGPPTHEVQSCSAKCSFPCDRRPPCEWDPCHISHTYPGGLRHDLIIEGEEYRGVLARSVRPLASAAEEAAAAPIAQSKKRRSRM